MGGFTKVVVLILVIIIGIPVVIWAFKPLLTFVLGLIDFLFSIIIWIIRKIKRE
jgi:hypothetical protein